jgi:hypothetical protein
VVVLVSVRVVVVMNVKLKFDVEQHCGERVC